ncbi:hypothetical protein B0T20DRAFT_489032 [Sordaria brevicollis]|uniref:Uncharacterized protein n=1 Tax=Sordaria brevicollis TaxID=83679 RepID=A0AAE0U5M8_SORBR|nr:hypothetical protein B0T20DRAFT_489032 [Sordaria brevicollis]
MMMDGGGTGLGLDEAGCFLVISCVPVDTPNILYMTEMRLGSFWRVRETALSKRSRNEADWHGSQAWYVQYPTVPVPHGGICYGDAPTSCREGVPLRARIQGFLVRATLVDFFFLEFPNPSHGEHALLAPCGREHATSGGPYEHEDAWEAKSNEARALLIDNLIVRAREWWIVRIPSWRRAVHAQMIPPRRVQSLGFLVDGDVTTGGCELKVPDPAPMDFLIIDIQPPARRQPDSWLSNWTPACGMAVGNHTAALPARTEAAFTHFLCHRVHLGVEYLVEVEVDGMTFFFFNMVRSSNKRVCLQSGKSYEISVDDEH